MRESKSRSIRRSKTPKSYSRSRSKSFKEKPASHENPLRIWVGGLSDRVTEDELIDVFEPIGKIVEVKIRSSRQDALNGKVFAFVEFEKPEAAHKAVKEMDQSYIKGNKVKIHWAQYKGPTQIRKSNRQNSHFNGNGRNQIWIGHIMRNDEKELESVFKKFGEIIDCRIRRKGNDMFGFVEYETSRACDKAIDAMDEKECLGSTINVAWAQSGRGITRQKRSKEDHLPSYSQNRQRRRSRSYNRSTSRRRGTIPRGDYKIEIESLPHDMTWMDLKRLGRKYGGVDSVTFARTWDEGRNHMGLLEFDSKHSLDDVFDALDGHRINGNKVYCKEV